MTNTTKYMSIFSRNVIFSKTPAGCSKTWQRARFCASMHKSTIGAESTILKYIHNLCLKGVPPMPAHTSFQLLGAGCGWGGRCKDVTCGFVDDPYGYILESSRL